MTPTLMSRAAQSTGAYVYCSSVGEVAEKLGVSPSTVRRQIRRLGVKRICGRAVAGFVCWPRPNTAVILPYAEGENE